MLLLVVFRLVTVNTIAIPSGVDGPALSAFAMEKFNVEIAGGLGPSVGKVWRVGLMGYNARAEAVEMVLTAFREGLAAQGWKGTKGAGGKTEL
jgi:alanine-glyoxylate transaminase/serine-glyoxylate transaminase/serine-pyruvate transaminase